MARAEMTVHLKDLPEFKELAARAEKAEGQLDDIRQWCHDWSADQWAARAILDRIGWPDETEATS